MTPPRRTITATVIQILTQLLTFFDSVLGVPSTLLFIFWFWLSFSMPNSGLGAIPGRQKEAFVHYMHFIIQLGTRIVQGISLIIDH